MGISIPVRVKGCLPDGRVKVISMVSNIIDKDVVVLDYETITGDTIIEIIYYLKNMILGLFT